MPLTANASPIRRISSESSLESRNHKATSIAKSSINRCSRDCSFIEDALRQGDIIGPGLLLQGEPVELIHIPDVPPRYGQPPAMNLQVVRKLGAGSYAVVYLVREILDPLTDEALPSGSDRLGREYAIKCLSKVGYDADTLDAQMVEATIQQTLPTHPNIVALYRTLQSQSYLLLLLEYVPGEDLFYFLEQARDHEEWFVSNPSAAPPTPSLLASLHPNQLLSNRRLHLIASMFSQMCDAVALCHREGVYHRDIKPENFIVTHLRTTENEQHVVVKLTDFGLATRDVESADVDCGSAPYMSYECRNNIAPTYSTAPADVWSLGIVLLNMLYHHNPWADTSTGACQSFMYYLEQPVAFFMQRFPGMTIAVAQFFAHHVFNLLDHDTTKPFTRVSAHDFALWARDLPIHLGPDSRRDPRIVFRAIQPASSPTSGSPYTTTATTTNSRHPAPVPVDQMLPYERGRESFESDRAGFREKAPPLLSISTQQPAVAIESDAESDEEGAKSRSASGNSGARRRRRAARGKGTGTPTSGNITPVLHTPQDEHLDQLATALQMRARQMSKAAEPAPPVPVPVSVSVPVPSVPPLKKKKSTKWENIFRRDSGSDAEYITPVVSEQLAKIEVPPTRQHPALEAPQPAFDHPPVPRTARAVHVNNIIMSLNPAVPASSSASNTSKSSAGSSQSREEARGRKKGRRHDTPPSSARRTPSAPNERQWRQNASAVTPPPVPTRPAWYHYVKGRDARQHQDAPSPNTPPPVPEMPVEYRTAQAQIVRQPLAPPRSPSPTTSTYTSGNRKSVTPSIRSISTVTSSASSNWRSSAWSRYAGSVRSVSTTATSVSSGSSWREAEQERPKTNVKDMDGIPWELDELPRHQFRKPKAHVPKSTPQPKHSDQLPRFPALGAHLDTIAEVAVNKPRRSAKGGTAPIPLLPSAEAPVEGADHPPATAEASTSTGTTIRKKASKSRLWWGRKGGN